MSLFNWRVIHAEAGVIGAFHAGWRGAVDGIGYGTVLAMVALGADPARIKANKVPIAVDIGLGLLFYIVARFTDVSTAAVIGAAAGVALLIVQRFVKITALDPAGIRTLADFETYVSRCKAHYWGTSPETRFLQWLIDRERDRCVSAVNDSIAMS